MVAGKASRVAYRPVTPDPEHPKALLLPFAAQLHITVAGHDPAWQYLLVCTKPPGLLRKSNYLWPSNCQASACSTCLDQTYGGIHVVVVQRACMMPMMLSLTQL